MEQATTTIHADPSAIRQVLLDALALPAWNEAFRTINGPAEPTVGAQYAVHVRPAFSGHLQYTVIEPTEVEICWQVPGFQEIGRWTIGAGGEVTHAFEQRGPLAAVLRPAYRGIAVVRLDRLANRISQLSRTS